MYFPYYTSAQNYIATSTSKDCYLCKKSTIYDNIRFYLIFITRKEDFSHVLTIGKKYIKREVKKRTYKESQFY